MITTDLCDTKIYVEKGLKSKMSHLPRGVAVRIPWENGCAVPNYSYQFIMWSCRLKGFEKTRPGKYRSCHANEA